MITIVILIKMLRYHCSPNRLFPEIDFKLQSLNFPEQLLLTFGRNMELT